MGFEIIQPHQALLDPLRLSRARELENLAPSELYLDYPVAMT